MRIEITSTQAGASRTRAPRTRVQSSAQPAARASVESAVAWAGPPLAASSLRVDPSKRGPFSAGCATPVPVRWDAVRG
ncbi:MAG: hypothetical protein P8Q97_08610 [Myxococcota bacterium]|nr:hypothetical protein [Myxococcota bacterium]